MCTSQFPSFYILKMYHQCRGLANERENSKVQSLFGLLTLSCRRNLYKSREGEFATLEMPWMKRLLPFFFFAYLSLLSTNLIGLRLNFIYQQWGKNSRASNLSLTPLRV